MFDPASFAQGVILGVFLGLVLGEIVLPRIVDLWTRFIRGRRG
jgi:hypothetical protein